MPKTDKIFPDYQLLVFNDYEKVVVQLSTNVRILEVNTQKWHTTKVEENIRCNSGDSIKSINDGMLRFLMNCYTQITVGSPNLSIVDVDSNPVFKVDDSQISEKERMEIVIKKLFIKS